MKEIGFVWLGNFKEKNMTIDNFKNKNILITGGTGTFGKNFINYCLNNNLFNKIVIFSRDEYKQHNLKNDLQQFYPAENFNKVRFIIGDIRDFNRLLIAFDGIDYCIHAAALKHIDICERNIQECIKTNVDGTTNVINACISTKIKKMVFLSTDKAVNIWNCYGMSKGISEKNTIFSNSYAKTTKFSACRWGNIFGSRGSIIETFLKQKENTKFLITNKEMTRFFLKIEDAVKLSLYCLYNMVGGEIFIPEIKASNIERIAKLIDENKSIEYSGIRPGEKLHECLINQGECERLYLNNGYYFVLPETYSWNANLYRDYKKFQINAPYENFVSNTASQFSTHEILEMIESEKHIIEK